MQLHHIGVACRDIEESIRNMSKIHHINKISPIVFDANQNARLVLLTLADGTNIELISGKQVESLVSKGISYYHLCYEVANIYVEIARLVNGDAVVISAPTPAVLFDNRQVAFLQVSYGIIELLESK